MRSIYLRFSAKIAGLALLLFPLVASAANDLAVIRGQVRDSTGAPITGALVIVAPSSPIIPERIAMTDKWGSFTVMNPSAAEYSIQLTMDALDPAIEKRDDVVQ